MTRLPRPEAETLAEQITDALRPLILKTVTDLLSEPDPDALTPRQIARVDRAAASWRRKMEGLPPERRRKVS